MNDAAFHRDFLVLLAGANFAPFPASSSVSIRSRPRKPKEKRVAPMEKNLMNEPEASLARWVNYYVLMGAAAATLIGLLFVVISLVAGGNAKATASEVDEARAKIRVYLTPTVVYFATVLCLAALLTFPNHTRLTAALCICIAGVPGILYSGSALVGGDAKAYSRRRDLINYQGLPLLAYGLLVLSGILLFHEVRRALTLAAIGMLLLLGIGIRNSWAIAITMVVITRAGLP
jgi:hypothetical protein